MSCNHVACCMMVKPSKSSFNVLRKSTKGFEKAAMPILIVIEQFISVFFISMCVKVDTDSYYSQKIEECTFKNKLIGFFSYD